ncbi:MAG: hypothetical protein GY749_34255 [Desulfobacteraceae bacterium]|nr:hypothetical protein [Desulfobacteraceae bacterium]
MDEEGDNKGMWRIDRSEDINAANQGINDEKIRGKRVGNYTLDKYTDQVFKDWSNNISNPSHHTWLLWSNCKTESDRLVEEAKSRADWTINVKIYNNEGNSSEETFYGSMDDIVNHSVQNSE